MARQRGSELAAGAFTIIALLVLIGVVFWLGASDILRPGKQEAWFYVNLDQGVQGLDPGAQVKITDVEVGKVREVHLDLAAGRTYYVVKLYDAQVKIYSDAEVSIEAALVGGGASIEILKPGTQENPLAGKDNPVRIQPTGFAKIMAQTDTLAEGLRGLLKTIANELDQGHDGSAMRKIHAMMGVLEKSLISVKDELDAGNEAAIMAKLHTTVEHLRDIMADAQPKVESTLYRIEKMVADAEPEVAYLLSGVVDIVDGAVDLLGGADRLVGDFRKITKEDVANILTELRKASTHLVTITGDFTKVSEDTKGIMSVNRDSIDEIIDNMLSVSTNLKSASKEIRRSPWRLLYQPKKGELHSQNIHDAARSFSSGAAQLDQALAKLKGLAAAHPKGLPADDPHLKEIAEQIKKTFEKFTEAEKALWKELSK